MDSTCGLFCFMNTENEMSVTTRQTSSLEASGHRWGTGIYMAAMYLLPPDGQDECHVKSIERKCNSIFVDAYGRLYRDVSMVLTPWYFCFFTALLLRPCRLPRSTASYPLQSGSIDADRHLSRAWSRLSLQIEARTHAITITRDSI